VFLRKVPLWLRLFRREKNLRMGSSPIVGEISSRVIGDDLDHRGFADILMHIEPYDHVHFTPSLMVWEWAKSERSTFDQSLMGRDLIFKTSDNCNYG